jgi:hypothetical protein
MGLCQIKIQGVGAGLLCHSPQGMIGPKTSRKVIPSPEEEAKQAAYWNDDKSAVGFPTWNIHQALVRAASGLKLPSNKKIGLSPIIAGDIELSPAWVSLGTKQYLIDSRRVVVQRQSIIRRRPWFPSWSLAFYVHWEESTLGSDFHETILPELLTTAGERIGIGDFRPVCKGPFGKFKVESITLIKTK